MTNVHIEIEVPKYDQTMSRKVFPAREKVKIGKGVQSQIRRESIAITLPAQGIGEFKPWINLIKFQSLQTRPNYC